MLNLSTVEVLDQQEPPNSLIQPHRNQARDRRKIRKPNFKLEVISNSIVPAHTQRITFVKDSMSDKRQQTYATDSPRRYPLRSWLNILCIKEFKSIPESNATNNPSDLH